MDVRENAVVMRGGGQRSQSRLCRMDSVHWKSVQAMHAYNNGFRVHFDCMVWDLGPAP